MRCQKSPLWCCLTYGEEFSKIKPSGHMYDTKCIFSAHIMCMVHTPFKAQALFIKCFLETAVGETFLKINIIRQFLSGMF